VVRSWSQCFDELKINYQIILVNDGSMDSTEKILDNLAVNNSRLRVVHQENSGHGPTIYNGYGQALDINPEWIFQVDSDDQFCPEDFPAFWEIRDGEYFISGVREKRYDPLHRLIITRILIACLFLIFQVRVRDANIPYRLIKTNFLRKLLMQIPPLTFAPNIFLVVLARRSNKKLNEVPVIHKERETGEVSIVRLKLLKVCIRSFRDLIIFRMKLKNKLESINV
jgi:dolichol-phosphate mannosyltransferase